MVENSRTISGLIGTSHSAPVAGVLGRRVDVQHRTPWRVVQRVLGVLGGASRLHIGYTHRDGTRAARACQGFHGQFALDSTGWFVR